MNMDSRTSISRGFEGYTLSINGRVIEPNRVNELELREENRIVLEPLKEESVRTSLYVDGVEIIDKSRPYEMPQAVEWRWKPSDLTGYHRVELRIEEVGEYFFEIYSNRCVQLGLDRYLEELRDFTLNLIYESYGSEMMKRLNEWFSYLSKHWTELEPVVERISWEPERRLYRERREKPIGEINGIDADLVRALLERIAERGGKRVDVERLRELLGKLVDKVIVEEERIDHDTPGNKLLKQHLHELLSKLEELTRSLEDLDRVLRRRLKEAEDEETVRMAKEFLFNYELRTKVESLRKRIQGRLRDPRLFFLKELGREAVIEEPEEVPLHYVELYRLGRIYKEKAPQPILKVEMAILSGRPTEIYRRWCAAKLLEAALKLGCELEEERIVSFNEESVEASLEMGLYSTLKGDGIKMNLYFGRRYDAEGDYGSYTSAKWATLSLEALSDEEDQPRIFVFEPRFDLEYTREKFERDVDLLHILKDAIIDRSTGQRLVIGGAVLHPAQLEIIRFDSLSAIPLRPGRLEGLIALFRELLS